MVRTRFWAARLFLLVGGAAVLAPARVPAQVSPHEEAILQLLAATEQITKVLATVKDGPTSEAARPQLKTAAEQFLTVRKKSEQLKAPDQKEKDALAAKYQKKLAEVVQSFRNEVRRVQTLPAAAGVLTELEEVLNPPKKKAP